MGVPIRNRRALRRPTHQAAALLVLCGAAAACGAPAVSATAENDWSTATTPIAPGIPASTGPALLVDGGDGPIASWEAPGRKPADPLRGGRLTPSSGNAAGQGRVVIAEPAPLKGGGAVQLEASKAADFGLSHLALRWLTADGITRRTAPLGSTGSVLAADLAVDPDGRLLVGWTQAQGTPGRALATTRMVTKLATLRPGSAKPTVHKLRDAHDAPTGDDAIAVALEGDRALAVIASTPVPYDRRQILATTGAADDAPKPLRRIAARQWPVEGLAAALVGGRPVIAWGEQHHGEEAESPWTIHTSVGAADGLRFGTPRVLDTGADRAFPPTQQVQLVARPDRTAVLAWSQPGPNGDGISGDGPGSTRAAFLKGATFGSPAHVADGAFGGLAVSAAGGLALTASTQDRPTTSGPGVVRITAALAAPGAASFGPSAPIGVNLGEFEGAQPPIPAFEASGRPIVGWVTQRDGKSTLSIAIGPLLR